MREIQRGFITPTFLIIALIEITMLSVTYQKFQQRKQTEQQIQIANNK